jgi:hypothetical protein
VDEALILAGRKRMGAVGGDGRFGRHAGVADGVGAAHAGKTEYPDDMFRQADFLVDLHGLADADEFQIAFTGFQPVDHGRGIGARNRQHDVTGPDADVERRRHHSEKFAS